MAELRQIHRAKPKIAYERLGDKEKAAGSYGKAINIRKDNRPAADGFARVGGKYGTKYKTFD